MPIGYDLYMFSGRHLIFMTVASRLVDPCGCSLAPLPTAYTSLISYWKASALLTTRHKLLLE